MQKKKLDGPQHFNISEHSSMFIVNCESNICAWNCLYIFFISSYFLLNNPEIPFPGHIKQLFLADPKVLPGRLRYIILPVRPGSALGSPPSWSCVVPGLAVSHDPFSICARVKTQFILPQPGGNPNCSSWSSWFPGPTTGRSWKPFLKPWSELS